MDEKSPNLISKAQRAPSLDELDPVLKGQRRLLIVVHDNPDPDAIASAAALAFLAEQRYGIRSSIAYGGMIGRAENRAMVNKLKIPLKQIYRIRFGRYERVALVDTQPGARNNSLPAKAQSHIVMDHHLPRPDLNAPFVWIHSDVGATATLLIEWLEQSNLVIPPLLATALAYAISSETQDLGREASQRDIQAYLKVFTRSSLRKLAQIIHPSLPKSYFASLANALHQAKTFRNLLCAHLGQLSTPDIVAEMADFFLRHQRTTWTLCTGQFGNELIISLRSSHPRSQAAKMLRSLIEKEVGSAVNRVGGHDMTAGGQLPLATSSPQQLAELEAKLSQGFARVMGYKEAEWKPLLNSELQMSSALSMGKK